MVTFHYRYAQKIECEQQFVLLTASKGSTFLRETKLAIPQYDITYKLPPLALENFAYFHVFPALLDPPQLRKGR